MLTIYPLICNSNKQYNSVKNPNFGYRLPKNAVNDLRDIPHLTCGCCGKEMISFETLNKFIKSFAPGSARTLENSILSKFKNSWAYSFVKSLSANNPRKTVDELLKSEEVQKQLQNVSPDKKIILGELVSTADKLTVKSPRVIQKLSKFYEFFSEENREIFDLMEIYAQKYPKNTFAEIFQKPEVAQHHTQLFELYKKQALAQKIEVFKRLKEFSKKLTPQDVKKLQAANNEALKVLNNEYYKPQIKHACVEDIYNNFLKTCETKRIRKKLFDIIKDIPYNKPAADEFIALCSQNKTPDKEIVTRFAQEMSATFEHVLAKSHKGKDAIENGIILCKKCNSERSNVPYRIYLKIHPEMKKNIQKQINRIITFINSEKLIGYDNYPLDIKKTLLRETDNLIKIKINKYLKYKEQQALSKIEAAKASLDNNSVQADTALQKLESINDKLETLMAEVRQLKKDKHRINEALTLAQQNMEHYENVMQQNEKTLEIIKKLIEEDIVINQSAKPLK